MIKDKQIKKYHLAMLWLGLIGVGMLGMGILLCIRSVPKQVFNGYIKESMDNFPIYNRILIGLSIPFIFKMVLENARKILPLIIEVFVACMILRKSYFDPIRVIITTACICILVIPDQLLERIVYYSFRISAHSELVQWAIVSIKNMGLGLAVFNIFMGYNKTKITDCFIVSSIVFMINMAFFQYPINTRWLSELLGVGGVRYANVALLQGSIGIVTLVGLKIVREYLSKTINKDNVYHKPKNEYILQLVTIGVIMVLIWIGCNKYIYEDRLEWHVQPIVERTEILSIYKRLLLGENNMYFWANIVGGSVWNLILLGWYIGLNKKNRIVYLEKVFLVWSISFIFFKPIFYNDWSKVKVPLETIFSLWPAFIVLLTLMFKSGEEPLRFKEVINAKSILGIMLFKYVHVITFMIPRELSTIVIHNELSEKERSLALYFVHRLPLYSAMLMTTILLILAGICYAYRNDKFSSVILGLGWLI